MKRRSAIIVAALALSMLAAPGLSLAQTQNTVFGWGSLRDCMVGSEGSDTDGDGTIEGAVAGGSCSIEQILMLAENIMRWLVGISGALALLMYVIGGLWLIFSGGASSRVERGKDIITGTTIALIFVLGSWLIIDFSLEAFNAKDELQLSQSSCESDKQCQQGESCDTIKHKCKTNCEIAHQNEQDPNKKWSCETLQACGNIPSYEDCGSATYPNCEKGLCPGGKNNVCCDIP